MALYCPGCQSQSCKHIVKALNKFPKNQMKGQLMSEWPSKQEEIWFQSGVTGEQERIIKLLEADCEKPLDPNWEHYRESCSCWQIALIKGKAE